MRNPIEPTEQKTTRYKNTRSWEQRFIVEENGTPTIYRFAPGEERAVPSVWDYAIHRVHNGVIMGGLAPQLTNLDRPELKLAEYLDTDLVARKEAEAKLVSAQLDKAKAEQDALVAAARIAQAEAAKAEAAKADVAKAEEKKK